MQFKVSTFVTLLASTVYSFIIPENLSDGKYVAVIDKAGEATITGTDGFKMTLDTRDGMATTQARSAKFGKLEARDSNGCTGHTITDQTAYHTVETWWRNFFDGGGSVAHNTIVWYQSGNVFIAMCNYGSAQGGYAYEIDNFNGVVDRSCGAWQTGWSFLSGPNKTLWRDLAGNSICTNI